MSLPLNHGPARIHDNFAALRALSGVHKLCQRSTELDSAGSQNSILCGVEAVRIRARIEHLAE